MNFLYPWFLVAAAAIAIPIIIHLFNFRKYKKVLFPDIRFLKELQEQTQKHSKLKHLLVLLSRILAVLSLVFAFAQPFFEKDRDKMTQGSKSVSLYVDNSFSMGIEKNDLSMLDLAKGKAKEVIDAYSENDQFQILTNDFGMNENRFLSKSEALRQLSSIQLSSQSRKAEVILEKQKNLLLPETSHQKLIVFISDFQKNNFSNQLNIADQTKKYFITVQPEKTNNVCIDTAYFESPTLMLNEPNILNVKLRNAADEEVNTSITMMVNQQLKNVSNTTLKANEVKNETLTFSTAIAGQQNLQLFIQDNPVQFDDTFYVAGKVNSNYSVLVLNQQQANAFLSSVFKPNSQFKVDNNNIQSFNPDILKNYSLVVLNNVTSMTETQQNALLEYGKQGGSLLVFAPQQNNTAGINTFLSKAVGCQFGKLDTAKQSVSYYNKSHPLFNDIFTRSPDNIELPLVYKHYVLNRSALSSEQKLFSFSNGDAFLSSFSLGLGKIFLCASSAEANASNFPKSYWFLPLIYKMAFSNAAAKIFSVTMGKNAMVEVVNKKSSERNIYHLKGNGVEIIPEQRSFNSSVQLYLNKGIQQAGLYGVYLEGSSDSTYIGVNYDRAESVMDFWKLSELKKSSQLKNAEWLDGALQVGGEVNALQHGMPLWKLCIILALIFLLLEILLIRFMK